MKSTHALRTHTPARRRTGSARLVILVAAAITLPGLVNAQALYPTPQAAADAFISSLASSDDAALAKVLGRDWQRLLPTDHVDREDIYDFLAKASQSRSIRQSGSRAELVVGKEPWTLPIPLVQAAGGSWRFNPVGAQALVAERRLGANERAAMLASLAYVDAQREYARADRDGNGVLEYAQKLLSSPGRRDGLIWSTSLGDESPLGEDFLPRRAGQGYHGYHFRILSAQGPAAPGGARSYLIGGRMRTGFALIGWPVEYGASGVMSFMVNQDGVVYERNLGPGSKEAAAAIKAFNPDDAWKPATP